VYKTYLPGRQFVIHAPVTTTGSDWPLKALQQIPGSFQAVDIHNYSANTEGYVRQVHGWMNQTGQSNRQLWISEWGINGGRNFDSMSLSLDVIDNLLRGSRPGNDYVYGSHIYRQVDKDDSTDGLFKANGTPRHGYYAFRMA